MEKTFSLMKGNKLKLKEKKFCNDNFAIQWENFEFRKNANLM